MSLKEISTLVEKDLAITNKKLNKYSRISIIDSAIETITSDKVFDINNSELSFIKTLNCLNQDEIEFLSQMISMPSEIRERLKSDNIINMLPLVPVIADKLEKAKEKLKGKISSDNSESLSERLEHLKIVLSKLNKNDINLVSDSDIDLITGIFVANDISLEEQIESLKTINQLNTQIFNNYGIQIEKNGLIDDETIDIDQLDETNIEFVALENLFKKYSINWEKDYAEDIKLKPNEDINENSIYKKRMQAIKEYKAKLLKHGHLGKIEELIIYLKGKKLSFVFNQPEILTKILLSSTKENIDRLIREFDESHLSWKEFIKNNPSVLYPNSKMTIKLEGNKTHGKKSSNTTSGSLNYCLKNIEFLKANGFDVARVLKDCEIFFIRKPSTQEKIYNRLKLYGLSLKYPDGTTKKGFSSLDTLDVLDKLDAGIECGCYSYYLDNVSKLVDSKFNLFKIKMAKIDGMIDDQLFRKVKSGNETKICISGEFAQEIDDKYGKTIEDSFRIYQAINVPIENKELYTSIVDNSDNDTITDYVLQDEYINQIDQLYKENHRVYNFNGVIISRFKVLRYYQTLITNPDINSSRDTLMYAITKNSMLNQNDYNNICICLDKIDFKSNAMKIKGEKR